MNKKITLLFLIFFILISLALHLIGLNKIPPCLNADEAAYGYNAYSILKTGKDEYGKFLPLRLKSFEDYKLPVYSYISIPFIAIFGLNDFGTRAANIFLGIAFVPLVYLIIKELFNDEKVGLIAAGLTSISTWIHIMSRQAQEGVSCAFLILLSFYFLIKYLKKKSWQNFVLTNLFIFLSTFAYHFGRIFLFFFVIFQIYLLFKNRKKDHLKNIILKIVALVLISVIPLIIDAKTLNRVSHLAFYQNIGFQLKLDEYLREHNFRLLHNKLTEATHDIVIRYFEQLSPEFLIFTGDKNPRFGFDNLGLITIVEYIFFFIGLYYLFKNKEKYRFLVLFIFFISPIANSLTWQDYSLIRTYPMIFPIIITVAYGIFHFFSSIRNRNARYITLVFIAAVFAFYFINNWDIYIFHYPKRAAVVRAWQCGYKELVDYVSANYSKFDRFVITDRHGQPYIFFLYYMKYDPSIYQKQAKISAPDEYGFGQIGHFDKYYFKFSYNPLAHKTVYVGYSEEFKGMALKEDKLKKIKIRTEEIFWIYEVD